MPDLANPQSLTPNPCTHPLYACLYLPPAGEQPAALTNTLVDIAQQFSPRYERHRDELVSVDVSGLERLLGPGRVIGEELRREATARGIRLHVAIAGTRMAALLLALARPGLTIVEPGGEADALAPIAVGIIETLDDVDRTSLRSHTRASAFAHTLRRDKSAWQAQSSQSPQRKTDLKRAACFACSAFKHWGLKTLGELAALPAADLVARLGRPAMTWQAIARGEDIGPLVPTLESERFESSLDLEWPIEGLEPLSFVLTRLLEPLSLRLEQRDRGVAVLHVQLRVVTAEKEKATHTRRLELPTPMRDVRTLRTLALLDLEAHPPASAIDRVAIVIDPTPGRVWQHTLFARPHPTPEQLSTLLARLGAAMGQDRIGAPVTVDSYRPGAFTMKPFAVEHNPRGRMDRIGGTVGTAVRRCRQPVPARVAADANGQPMKVTTDRRGFAGGSVLHADGPWKTSGEWWPGQAGEAGRAGQAGWDRDEWDVALSDGASYRVFFDRATSRWFIDAIID